jgi:hypothetical protein
MVLIDLLPQSRPLFDGGADGHTLQWRARKQQHAIGRPKYFMTKTKGLPRQRRGDARNREKSAIGGLFSSSNAAARA